MFSKSLLSWNLTSDINSPEILKVFSVFPVYKKIKRELGSLEISISAPFSTLSIHLTFFSI